MEGDVTGLLKAHHSGDELALEELARVVYPDLKAMARRRASGGSSPSASTLVNETFIKLLSHGRMQPDDRKGFFALMATIMRRVVIDDVRQALALKRKGKEVTANEGLLSDGESSDPAFLLDVDAALSDLKALDPRLQQVFDCRYFAGYTTAETAEALDLSARTVERAWSEAKAFVANHIDRPAN